MFYKLLFVIMLCLSNIALSANVEIKAIVNNEIITSYDIAQRKKLSSYLLNHSNIKMKDEDIEKNVFNEMIDDKIKISEAKKYGISASPDEIEQAKSNMARALKLPNESYDDALKSLNLEESVLNEQIRGDIIWMKFTMQVLRAYVKVQDREVDLYIDNMKNANSFEYTIIPLILKGDDLSNMLATISTCSEFEDFAKSNGKEGSGIKIPLVDSQMQKELYELVKTAPLSTPLESIKLNGNDTVFFICDKKPYTPIITKEERENIKYMILQNKLDAYANKYFEKIKANAILDIKD